LAATVSLATAAAATFTAALALWPSIVAVTVALPEPIADT